MSGNSNDCSNRLAYICPAIWWTPINGFCCVKAMALVALTPISNAPTSPGPSVTAIPSMSIHVKPDFSDRKSTRLNSSHVANSYAVFCLKIKTKQVRDEQIIQNNIKQRTIMKYRNEYSDL